MEKLKIDCPIIVEGRYDKVTLDAVLDATVIPTNGFSIFNNKEKMALIRRLGGETGIIVLTDSDGAGQLIRAHLSSALPKDKIIHLYTPAVLGKESRKKAPSKEGYLGVEGMAADCLRTLFAPFAAGGERKPRGRAIEKKDFYMAGLSGGAGAAERREKLAAKLALPRNMSANSLLAAVNLLYSHDEFAACVACLEESEDT